jgi:hypothetical protein
MTPLQPRQIGKVVYEAIRAYEGTIGQADKPTWERAKQEDRDAVLIKVDALLRGQPHGPVSIRPSDQMRQRLLTGIVASFIQVYAPTPVYVAPPPPPPEAPAIPVEVFADPDVVAGDGVAVPVTVPDGPLAPATISDALAQADANIAEASR